MIERTQWNSTHTISFSGESNDLFCGACLVIYLTWDRFNWRGPRGNINNWMPTQNTSEIINRWSPRLDIYGNYRATYADRRWLVIYTIADLLNKKSLNSNELFVCKTIFFRCLEKQQKNNKGIQKFNENFNQLSTTVRGSRNKSISHTIPPVSFSLISRR